MQEVSEGYEWVVARVKELVPQLNENREMVLFDDDLCTPGGVYC